MNSRQPSKQVVVVGGGIIGLCSAAELQQRGHHVTVIDPGNCESRASTATAGIIGGSAVVPWASSGLWLKIPAMLLTQSPLTLSFPFPRNLLTFFYQSYRASESTRYKASATGLAKLGLSGYDNWMRLLKDTDCTSEIFRQTGCYFVYPTQSDRSIDVQNNTLRKAFGMQLQDLDSDQTNHAIPSLEQTQSGSVKVVNAGHVIDPTGLQQALRTNIEREGGELVTASVSHFETNGSQVLKVFTVKGEYDVDHIVIAAGFGSAMLARKLGCHVPVIPGVGYCVRLVGANVHLDAPLLFQRQGIAVTPENDGIRVAGLVSIGGKPERNCKRRCKHLLNSAKSLFTDLRYRSLVCHSGVRPLTTDSLPVIDRSPRFQNAWFNFGHGHWGLTQAASSAQVLAKLFAQEVRSDQSNPFSASRF